MARKVKPVDTATIASIWNDLAQIRFDQIRSGEDITFNHVLAPLLLKWAKLANPRSIIDAGCGTGVLSSMLIAVSSHVVGVDVSEESIRIAEEYFGQDAAFHHTSVEQFASLSASKFDLAVANMVLMDCSDLDSFLSSISTLLSENGTFIWSMPHPWFWPNYYGYDGEDWFDYQEEIFVEANFKISNSKGDLPPSIHVHRPLSTLIEKLRNAGFSLESLLEPIPSVQVQAMYPEPWKHPRYLLGRCSKR